MKTKKDSNFINLRDSVWMEYIKKTNMNYSELKSWSLNPCSKKASLSREPLRRNLRLLSKPKFKWNSKDIMGAKKTISFILRHKNQPRGNPVSRDCPYSKRTIALRNWAYDPLK